MLGALRRRANGSAAYQRRTDLHRLGASQRRGKTHVRAAFRRHTPLLGRQQLRRVERSVKPQSRPVQRLGGGERRRRRKRWGLFLRHPQQRQTAMLGAQPSRPNRSPFDRGRYALSRLGGCGSRLRARVRPSQQRTNPLLGLGNQQQHNPSRHAGL